MAAGRKKYIVTFLVTALTGLAVGAFSTPVLVASLLGEGALVAASFGLPLSALVAAIAGYLLPKGFWLWGMAVISLDPVLFATLTTYGSNQRLLEAWSLSGLILVGMAVFVGLATMYTGAAALGAGLRLLWWRLRGESIRDRLGMFAGSSDPA